MLGSPADLHVYGPGGGHVGPDGGGGFEVGIPGAFRGELDGHQIVWVPNDGSAYEAKIVGTGTGEFDLTVFEADAASRVVVTEYVDVPVAAGTLAETTSGAAAPALFVDADGDGTTDSVEAPVFHAVETVSRSSVYDRLRASGAPESLYPRTGAIPLGDPTAWPGGVADPTGVFASVARLHIGGFATGELEETIAVSLQVPAGADLVSIPLATGLNGPVAETDSEAAVRVVVRDPATGETVTTYATNIMDTSIGEPWLYAFGDLSPFRGRLVEVAITLLQPEACAGALCTHEIDLLVGPIQIEALPELCTTEPDGTRLLYDYIGDPTPAMAADCAGLPVRLVEMSARGADPFVGYGAGEDTYRASVDLPEVFELLDVIVHAGPRIARLAINGTEVPGVLVNEVFTEQRPTYNRVPDSARWSFRNHSGSRLQGYFAPGENTMEIVVAATEDYEERPFSLLVRFVVPETGPAPTDDSEAAPDDGDEPATTTSVAAAPDRESPDGGVPVALLAALAAVLLTAAGAGWWVRRRRN
jgi:hypothetical protein